MKISLTGQNNESSLSPKAGSVGTGERSTKQKKALAQVIESSDSFLSAQEIFIILRGKGENIGLTTIYSQLRALVEQGELDSIRSEAGETLYRKCSAAHHHHLICKVCGTTIEIEPPGFEEWAEKVSKENGFHNITHVIEVVGICSKCFSKDN